MNVGDIFYESWGYDQTQNDFAQIIRFSPTGKTAICRMVGKTRVGSYNVAPKGEPFGIEFRLRVDDWQRREGLKGSYPYVQGETRITKDPWNGQEHEYNPTAYRRGYFTRYEGTPVYETPDGMGH